MRSLLPRLLYAIGLGSLVGRLVLLLTTTGRKTGRQRITAVGYEQMQGEFYLPSVIRGVQSDWYQNAKANPHVHIRVGTREFDGLAEPVTEVRRIVEVIQCGLRRHPWISGVFFAIQGLPGKPSREDLEAYAAKIAMLTVRPEA